MDFLAQYTPLLKDTAVWGAIHLEETLYLSDQLPPVQYVTSVRAIVFHEDKVLVVRDQDDHYHVVPGGRRETQESLEETLRREVLEETGWTIKDPCYFSFVHFRHLTPCPPEYTYPYPDFVHLLYTAAADQWLSHAKISDDYVVGANFVPLREVGRLKLDDSQKLLLDIAQRERPVDKR
jgi:8-oxo-dGTP diphosphatase